MPLLSVTHRPEGLALHRQDTALCPVMQDTLARSTGAVRILVHGFNYAPGQPRHCPHDSLFSMTPDRLGPRIVSWPRHLGLRGQAEEPLVIGFGWQARGGLPRAYDAASAAGRALAGLVAQCGPERPVQIMAHSLGARVALQALHHTAPGVISHMILLAAAEFTDAAVAALHSDAGRACTVLHATGRENDLFDLLFETLLPQGWRGARGLGHACPRLPNLTTLHLDDPTSREALRALGYPVADSGRRVCHWSPYTRAGVFPLYRAFLDRRLPPALLRAALPDRIAPRWSRLRPALSLPAPQWRILRQS